MILKYIYTGELDLTKQSGEDILELLVSSDELLLEELFEHVQVYLIEKQTDWIRENFVLILHTVIKFDNCKLKEYCFEYICKDLLPFITSKSFLSIDDEILFTLLRRDDLQIKEDDIWDNLIKWGIEQTPSLGSNSNDRTKWNNENYEALKETLHQFIPLIRFVGISRINFVDEVYPYKNIIPNHIYKEIEEFYHKGILPSLPHRIGRFESDIIKPKLAKIIANWIDKKDAMLPRTGEDPLYKFELIYRGSRDGINNNSFKNKCNGQVASLVLIKGKESNEIFGGYSSIGLSSLGDDFYIEKDIYDVQYYYSSDNFIFSFENNEDIQNMKIGYVINESKATLEYSGHGFNFGWGSFCMINQAFQVNNRSNYEKIISTYIHDTIAEIETFIVIKQ